MFDDFRVPDLDQQENDPNAQAVRPGEPILTILAEVAAKPTKWLWDQRIPLAKVSVFVGPPGQGKTFASLDIASRVSLGTIWPDGSTNTLGPGGVVLFAAEDDAADTIVPRLEALGADRTRITVCTGIATTSRGDSRAFTLEDIEALKIAVDKTPNCRLIIIDPVSAFEPGGKSSTIQTMRRMLAAITALAAERELAVLLITHLNKSGGKTALSRIAGSQALPAAARAVWLISKDPLDKTRRLIVPVKNNLGLDSSGLAFEITGSPPTLEWLPDPVTMSADDLVRLDGDSRLSDTAAFLIDYLADGPCYAEEIKEVAKQCGLGWRTVQTAKGLLGIMSMRSGFGGAWYWCLPRHYAQASKGAKSAEDAKNANNANSATPVIVRPHPMLPPGKADAA